MMEMRRLAPWTAVQKTIVAIVESHQAEAMLSKPVPVWILGGGFVLAAMAGAINAVGFLGVHHQALAHMSGPLTILGNEIARSELGLAMATLLVVLAFFAGCGLSAAIIGPSSLKLGRRYGVVLTLEAVMLTLAWWGLRRGLPGGECFAAFACGLQNAMASNYSGAVIRTTHMTGIVTDLGIAVGHLVRRAPVDRRRVGLFAVLLSGFLVGGVVGSYGFVTIGFNTLLIPAVVAGLAGTLYTLFEHLRRSSPAPAG